MFEVATCTNLLPFIRHCVVSMLFRLNIKLKRAFSLSLPGTITTILKKFCLPHGHIVDKKIKSPYHNLVLWDVAVCIAFQFCLHCESLKAAVTRRSKLRQNCEKVKNSKLKDLDAFLWNLIGLSKCVVLKNIISLKQPFSQSGLLFSLSHNFHGISKNICKTCQT